MKQLDVQVQRLTKALECWNGQAILCLKVFWSKVYPSLVKPFTFWLMVFVPEQSTPPQGSLVFLTGVKSGWRFAWQTMMKELAPQTADGSYSRPSYDFQAKIGDADFPVSLYIQ